MRVGVYVSGYMPDAGGGYTFEHDILDNLIKLIPGGGHEFVFFSHNPSRELSEFLNKSSNTNLIDVKNATPLKIRAARKINSVLATRRYYPGHLSFAVEKAGIDVLWFITPIYEPVNIPYITTVWDLQHRLQPWFPEVGSLQEWSSRERYYSTMIQRASYIITGSQAGAEEISLFYQIRKDRIRTLPHPTPAFALDSAESNNQAVLKKYDLSPGFLFYPAQFWPHKNHINLLHALKILGEEFGASLDLVLVGSDKGNKGYVLGVAKELAIENRVHVLGFVSRQELVALYQSALALTYVTFFGPDNLPPLEAFALGCPVIASAVSGAEEQLGNAAILVNPSRPEDIAKAVKNLLNDPSKRARLIERGQARASKWTGRDFVMGVFNILDEFEQVRRSWK